MTKKRSIIFFWILVLVPTLIMGAVALNLLRHEQERIDRSKSDALNRQAETIAQTIHLTLEGVRDNMIKSLMALPQDRVKESLMLWERSNPLVRNIFIYSTVNGLIYPEKGLISTSEERQFMSRYDGLLTGRSTFEVSDRVVDNESLTNESARPYPKIVNKLSSRRQLESLSRVDQSTLAASPEPTMLPDKVKNDRSTPRSGWLPWFYENRLSILVWVRPTDSDPYYGIELELMTLLSRLVVDFPALNTETSALVLIDGSQRHIHQSGRLVLDSSVRPDSWIRVSALLPHWQIGIFYDSNQKGAKKGFLVLSLLILGVFIVAILSGGVLLTRAALKSQKDARQKTSFVSSVSHELKTPLTSIRMYAELLQSGRIKDGEKKNNYLSVIVTESERLTRLINNVLDFSRLEQKKKKYHFHQINMETLLKEIIETHKIRIQSHELEIITEIEKADYWIKTDRDALEQVVVNLIDNSIKYAGDGAYIKFVLVRKSRSEIWLKVCDDGPGIPANQKDRVFEKFYRIDNSLAAARSGSGLGLSIARQILKDLGGDLVLDEEINKGSCFTARIRDYGSI